MTTILHVEDDPLLPELVRDAFEAFGFSGTFLVAATLAKARGIIEDTARYPSLDLVISDMRLPDGSGLDVVQHLRSHPARASTPLLILSGEADPASIDRAYALGANSYVMKTARDRDRSIADVMRTLFEHWLQDVQLPVPSPRARTRAWLTREVKLRRRFTQIYMNLAEQLGPNEPRGGFWTDVALRQGNVASLLSFLLNKLGDRELPAAILDDAEAMQAVDAQVAGELEQYPVSTDEDVRRYLRRFVPDLEPMPLARAVSHLFPVVPVAVTTLRDIASRDLEDLADWLDLNTSDPTLRDQIAILREKAARVRSSLAATPVSAPPGSS